MKTFVINLDRCPDRMQSIKQQLNTLNLPFERISAVDKHNLTSQYICSITHNSRIDREWLRPLNAGQIACFLSHKKCWEALLNSKENWALILEDDAELSADIKNFFIDDSPENWCPNNVKLIQLESAKQKTKAFNRQPNIIVKGRNLINMARCVHGTAGYLIHRSIAKTLLETYKKFDQPVDLSIFSIWSSIYNRIRPYQMNPGLIRQKDFQSDISSHKKESVSIFLRYHPIRIWRSILISIKMKNSNRIRIDFK